MQEWQDYRFAFSGNGVHGLPWYSGRSVRILGLPESNGIRFRLHFSGRSDHSSQSSGSWERKPGAALWLRCDERKAEFAPDFLSISGPISMRIQALGEKTIYLDLQQEGALLFSGKAHRSLWAFRMKFLPGSYRSEY
ncbi:MAG: hypothetical protein CMF59_11240 [Leptospiraceae bacterium]|nr:hypothetical protein [Leptospiraceae bacterium]